MKHLASNPPQGFEVFFTDVQDAVEPAGWLSGLLTEISRGDDARRKIQKRLPWAKKALAKIESIEIASIKVELKKTIAPSWREFGEEIFSALESLSGDKWIIIVDEFPLMLAHMLKRENGVAEVEELLTWFRQMRLGRLRDRVRFLIGGSIGIEGLLQRHGLIGLINDLDVQPLGPFDDRTAAMLLELLALDANIELDASLRQEIVERLGCAIPFHLQLVISKVADECHLRNERKATPQIVDACFDQLIGPGSLKDMGHYDSRLRDALAKDDLTVAYAVLGAASIDARGVARERAVAIAEKALARDAQDCLLRAMRVLEHDGYLIYQPPGDGEPGRYRFWSGLLREWWRRQFQW